MTISVKFDDYDSSEDFGMVLISYGIEPLKRKTHYVSIPGRSGDLDLSDYLGEAYENREITIQFYKAVNIADLNAFMNDLEDALNGNRMNVIFGNDEYYYWDCRVSISSVEKISNNAFYINFTCNADPFKVSAGTQFLVDENEDYLINEDGDYLIY